MSRSISTRVFFSHCVIRVQRHLMQMMSVLSVFSEFVTIDTSDYAILISSSATDFHKWPNILRILFSDFDYRFLRSKCGEAVNELNVSWISILIFNSSLCLFHTERDILDPYLPYVAYRRSMLPYMLLWHSATCNLCNLRNPHSLSLPRRSTYTLSIAYHHHHLIKCFIIVNASYYYYQQNH